MVKAGLLVVAQKFERHKGISQTAMSSPIVVSVLQFVYRAQLICVPHYKTFMYCLFISVFPIQNGKV